MRGKWKRARGFLPAIALGGCVISADPIVTDARGTLEPRQLGTWDEVSGSDHAVVSRTSTRRTPSNTPAAMLSGAGFRFPRSLPEVDPFNFVSLVTIPVLILNGRYDHYFPVETSQKPMFMFLGTPAHDKKWIVSDGGHFVPREELIKETLAWLDRFLGPAK